jgi:hypothetical protein
VASGDAKKPELPHETVNHARFSQAGRLAGVALGEFPVNLLGCKSPGRFPETDIYSAHGASLSRYFIT